MVRMDTVSDGTGYACSAEAAPAASPAPPTVEQRVAGLEAYVNNVDRPEVPSWVCLVQATTPG